jgi:transcriptional regulator with XRE-family HTH domain
MEKILKRIRETRKQRGYSLENMATELNISDSAYRKIENNQTKLSLEKFLQITKILDVSINDLVGEKSHREYNQNNNDQGTFIGHQEFENYYQESKEMTHKLLDNLESNIKYLQEEILFLRNQLSGKQPII